MARTRRRKPAPSRRKPAEFDVPIKLWVSQEMFDELAIEAKEREWSIPQLIRRRIRDGGRGD
jgi:hypothetical protein